jgi:hypothetical protein
MKFELNEYHRNVSNEELINDVKRTANHAGKNTLTSDEYSKLGKFHSTTLVRRFGSWKKVLELSNLETKGHSFAYTFNDDDVKKDLYRVAKIYDKETLTKKEYDKYGKYHSSTLMKRYNGRWNDILSLANMKVNLNRNFSDEDLFEEIERIWILLGRQPTTTDIKKGISKYSLNSYSRRFGGWRNALQAFVDYINDDEGDLREQSFNVEERGNASETNLEVVQHKTPRDVNLKLRFKTLQRDNFKCCACGASPAKDTSVELHIDHIIPWSKGGETVIDNLQTLCSKCNLGKSDMV